MTLPRRINTLEDLREYLQAAVQLELSVIPPYMCALYTIEPNANDISQQIIRSVIVEEMLHLINAANTLNAVGGRPTVTGTADVPRYPTMLPDGEKSFVVHLDPFSPYAVETFLKIEYPSRPHTAPQLTIKRPEREATPLKVTMLGHKTVGEFYDEIKAGIRKLVRELGEPAVFTGNPNKQISAAFYYAGGGEPVEVRGEADALRAIDEIIDQGEGDTHSLLDNDGDLGHYFRFEQIHHERRYRAGDEPDNPTGLPLPVDYGRVYPMIRDPRLDDYPAGELRQKAEAFNATYSRLLKRLQAAFDGAREELIPAVGVMFEMKYLALELLKNPLEGTQHNAGPTFEWVE